MREQLYLIKTEDNEKVALWRLSTESKINKHIFLTHGTFSNRKICDGIASYFCDKGYTCWSLEWRNHGHSPVTQNKFNLETIAKFDLKSTFDFLFDEQHINSIDCIAHSGGGIAIIMLLINHPKYRDKVKSISLFGVQAFAAGTELSNRFKIILSKYFSSMLGFVPAKMAGSSEKNESYYTMKQWFNWNIRQNFLGDDGYDYLPKMKEISIPILSICGKGDNFIAPKIGCEKFINAFENKKNKLVYASKENGFLEDYNHGRIIKSKNAKIELWPIVAQWMEKHSGRGNH